METCVETCVKQVGDSVIVTCRIENEKGITIVNHSIQVHSAALRCKIFTCLLPTLLMPMEYQVNETDACPCMLHVIPQY